MGFFSLHNPFAGLVGIFWHQTDLRSFFCLIVFMIVSLFLAYLTNPTENSFRAYLTEQSFRIHLSRLDDNIEDVNRILYTRADTLTGTFATQCCPLEKFSTFHFANRASISLRTPKHGFHSFGLFTIAAVVPLTRFVAADESGTPMICDSWYIGAFGHWWRGGMLEAWYCDVISRATDRESWNSGILHMKNLDIFNDIDGLPFSTKNLNSNCKPPASDSKPRKISPPPRRSTPPPLPKSASLPFHASRVPLAHPSCIPLQPPLLKHPRQSTGQVTTMSSLMSSSQPELAPRMADVILKNNILKSTVLDLRNQLSECQLSASQNHSFLRKEIEVLRERKRQEDYSKAQVKSRTKTIDDSKRQAETIKRVAEKKLKSAQSQQETAAQRIISLSNEISRLKQRVVDDKHAVYLSEEDFPKVERKLSAALGEKKREIKEAEDMVILLNHRARGLEVKLSAQKQRLERLKNEKQTRDDCQLSSRYRLDYGLGEGGPLEFGDSSSKCFVIEPQGPTVTFDISDLLSPSLVTLDTRVQSHIVPPTTYGVIPMPYSAVSPKRPVLLEGYTKVPGDSTPSVTARSDFFALLKSDRDVQSLQLVDSSVTNSIAPSLPTTSLSSEQSPLSERHLDKGWEVNASSCTRPGNGIELSNDSTGLGLMKPSSVLLRGPPFFKQGSLGVGFEVGKCAISNHTCSSDDLTNIRCSHWTRYGNSERVSDQMNKLEMDSTATSIKAKSTGSKIWPWLEVDKKPPKRLNPDAKEFNLPWKLQTTISIYDALNPNGIASISTPTSTSTDNSSVLRAFAPSPEERETLKRAMGGYVNSSFERLPSLCDVEGIAPSVNGSLGPLIGVPTVIQLPVLESPKSLPSWLQALPQIRKPNFSPWDDEVPVSSKRSFQEDREEKKA